MRSDLISPNSPGLDRSVAVRSAVVDAAPLDTSALATVARRQVLYEHDFSDPMRREDRFTHLLTPGEGSNCGSTQWIRRGGVGRVATIADNQAGGLAMGIARLGQHHGDGVYLYEGLHSIETLNYSGNYPRYYDVGLDTARWGGTDRRFFYMRYLNYDEAAGAIAKRWQLAFGRTGMVDLPIPFGSTALASYWHDNENKALPMKIDLLVDTRTGHYLGVRFANRFGLGLLADRPDDSLRALGPIPSHDLLSFPGGINICQAVANRTTGSRTTGQINCHFARLTYLGETY